jgi:ParB family transcriptional regulator, chromosome partitioning protein
MVQQGGLGRGLASLIPQRNLKQKQADEEIRKTDEEQPYFGSLDKQNKVGYYPLAKTKNNVLKKGFENENKAMKKKETSIVETLSQEKKEEINGTELKNENRKPKETKALEEVKKIAEKNITEEKIALRKGMEFIAVDLIVPNPHQPRTRFNESKLAELADSIVEHGIIQPLIVTKLGEDEYELIAGERRLEAAKIAGLKEVPIVIRDINDQKKAEWALVENVQRHDLNSMEEAKAYKKMQENFDMTQEEIAVRVGKSRSTIANSLRLLHLPIEIQRALMDEKISEGHAKTILGIINPEKQRALFELILRENLNVRQTEMKVREILGGEHRKKKRDLDPETYSKQEELSQSLGTKVEIKKSLRGGKIIIDFYSEEEFDSLLNNLTT